MGWIDACNEKGVSQRVVSASIMGYFCRGIDNIGKVSFSRLVWARWATLCY